MPRLNPIDPATASGHTKELLDGVQEQLGMTPNLMRTMANSPAVLDAYLGFMNAMSRSSLPAKLREQIALAVAEANGCRYCLAAHSAVGRMVGLSDEAIRDSRRGESTDSRTAAALAFTRALVDKLGWTEDADLDRVRAAGFDDGQIAEIVAAVALNTFSNYFNHVADTDVDFPHADPLPAVA